jgi:hypothetical protein
MQVHQSDANPIRLLRQDLEEELTGVFERLRAAMQAALDAAAADPRSVAGQMRAAVIEARTALERMQESVQLTERQLAAERRQLEDAERRGRLARGIQDTETVAVAERFAEKHRERVTVLEQKAEAQRKEFELARREYDEMKGELLAFEKNRPETDAARRVEAAWRDIEAAGGTRPDGDADDAHLRRTIDRAAREAHAEAQLDELKKRMGKR